MLVVGNTHLIKIKKLCALFNLPNLFIKDESENPFGTIKDRRTSFIVEKAVESNVDKLVLITSGNDGYSLGKFCEGTKVKLVNVIDKTTNNAIKQKLRECSQVIAKDLSHKISSEELINIAKESPKEIVWDVCTGFFEAHESLFSEIMGVNPSVIVLPVGSGNTFVSLYNSIKKHKNRTKLVGVTSKNTNHSFADKLANPFPAYKTEYEQMLKEGHQLIRLDEAEIKSAYAEFKNFVVCEPSSTVVFAALKKLKLSREQTVVVINSGKGLI